MSRTQRETEEVIARAIDAAEKGDLKSAVLALALSNKALSDQVEELRRVSGYYRHGAVKKRFQDKFQKFLKGNKK